MAFTRLGGSNMRSRLTKRPLVSDIPLAIAVTAWLLATANATFWAKGATYFADHTRTLVALGVALAALHIVVFLSVSIKYIIKPIYIFAILVAASASWYSDSLGVVIDRNMIANVMTTTTNEAKHLITGRFVVHMLVFGILPSLAIAWVRIDHKPFGRKVMEHLVLIVPCLLLTGGLVFLNFPGFASNFREHHDLMGSLNPIAPVVATVKFGKVEMADRNIVAKPLGTDAKYSEPGTHADKPHVLVIVAGETARAKDFSLFGYERETNPVLKAHDNIVTFANTTSCGTSTGVSLPCMFSVFTSSEYSESKSKGTETLIDVLDHAGVHTEWWDANTGSKGVAKRTIELYFGNRDDPRFCLEGECRDDILVDKLKQELPKVTGNTVFVLHQIGSHGPAYYMRYVEETAPFKPDCRSADFADCTNAEIRNAYDNSIAYTDKILGDIIDTLSAQHDHITGAMIYVSDHGESLGENGLYLHGAPWFMAPEEQTHVPFIAWLSPEHIEEEGVDLDCIRARSGDPHSHDNLFHSVLGIMEIGTEVYDRTLDVFAGCNSYQSAPLGG